MVIFIGSIRRICTNLKSLRYDVSWQASETGKHLADYTRNRVINYICISNKIPLLKNDGVKEAILLSFII